MGRIAWPLTLLYWQALYVLIKQMNCKEMVVIDALLEQLNTAYNWKVSFFNVFLAFSSLQPYVIEVL